MMVLGPKMSHLHHSGHNESFSEKSERVILNHFLMPVITAISVKSDEKLKSVDIWPQNYPFLSVWL